MSEHVADLVERLPDVDVFVYHGRIFIPDTYTAGSVGSKFLIELRDNKRIMGTRCPACNRVYVPARSMCKDCFEQLDQWVEVSDKGTVLTYAVACQPTVAQPVAPPIIYGIVQLDGADTGLVHMIGEIEFEKLHIGMRVQAVFKEQRTANILDIKYFRPLC
jgi:uncharacterized OB-fold protein